MTDYATYQTIVETVQTKVWHYVKLEVKMKPTFVKPLKKRMKSFFTMIPIKKLIGFVVLEKRGSKQDLQVLTTLSFRIGVIICEWKLLLVKLMVP